MEETLKIKSINRIMQGKKHTDSSMSVGILDLCEVFSCFQDTENLTG